MKQQKVIIPEMNRRRKIMLIEKYRPALYSRLFTSIPSLLYSPESASDQDIQIYNILIAEEARDDNNNELFRKRFSF